MIRRWLRRLSPVCIHRDIKRPQFEPDKRLLERQTAKRYELQRRGVEMKPLRAAGYE